MNRVKNGNYKKVNKKGKGKIIMIIKNMYKTKITCNGRCNIDTTTIVGITLTDFNNDPVENETVELFYDNNSQGTKTTNTNGVAAYTLTPTTWGLHSLRCNDTNTSFEAKGYKSFTTNSSYVTGKYDKNIAYVDVVGKITTSANKARKALTSRVICDGSVDPTVQQVHWGVQWRVYMRDDGIVYLQDMKNNATSTPNLKQHIPYALKTIKFS